MVAGGFVGAYVGGFIKPDNAITAKLAALPVVGKLIPTAETGADRSGEKDNGQTVSNRESADQLALEEKVLQEEREKLLAKEQELAQLETELRAREAELEEQEGTAEVHNAKVKRLAKTYAAMKPDAAAKIMSELQDGLVVEIFAAMKDEEVAAILSKMEPKRAAQLVEAMRNYEIEG